MRYFCTLAVVFILMSCAPDESGIATEQNGYTANPGYVGPAGVGCTVTQETYGALITCGDTKAVILHGKKFKNNRRHRNCDE